MPVVPQTAEGDFTLIYCTCRQHQLWVSDVAYPPTNQALPMTLTPSDFKQASADGAIPSLNPSAGPLVCAGVYWDEATKSMKTCGCTTFAATGSNISADTPVRRQGNTLRLG